MKILEKIMAKQKDLFGAECVTIAFLGDSVTQGCFEVYPVTEGLGVVFDEEHCYHNCLKKMFAYLYPEVPVNIIKAGISGSRADSGAERLERDVLRYHPDLVVVCFGLNDSGGGIENLENYKQSLGTIFSKLKEKNIDVIFMTPNMMNTRVSLKITDSRIRKVAEEKCRIQKEGIMDLYMEAARSVCREHGVLLCDCYKKWKQMEEMGVDTTEMLSNYINHPSREMSWLFAVSLFETIMEVAE